MTKTELSFLEDFPPRGRDDWRALLKRIVGDGGEDALATTTRDGLRIAAVHAQRHPGRLVAARPGGVPWGVVQRIEHPDPAAANRLIHAEIAAGVGGIELVFAGSPAAAGSGVAVAGRDDMARLLADVDLSAVHWRLDAGGETDVVAALLVAECERRALAVDGLDLALGPDPGAAAAFLALSPQEAASAHERAVDAVLALRGRGAANVVLPGDGRPWHAAGATDAQELAFALAGAVAHLRLLEDCGLDLPRAQAHVAFALAADTDQFATVAKIRACRLMWRRVQEACGLDPAPARVHAETAWRTTTRRDPWTNLLRGSVAVAGAALGGADSIAVLPFTAALGVAAPLARRLARNTQFVLMEEAGLADVADPAAGSGYVETLTGELAGAAWSLFREIEARGGPGAAVADGWAPAIVARAAGARLDDVATRRESVLGVSEFAVLDEARVDVLEAGPPVSPAAGQPVDLPPPGDGARFAACVAAVRAGATLADLAPRDGDAPAPRVAPIRLAAPYEALRDAADAYAEAHGRRPAVVLATLGPRAEYGARAGWMRNVLAAGGVDAVEQPADDDAAFGAGGDPFAVACLCGTDAAYAAAGGDLVAALYAAGAARIHVVGEPGAAAGALREAGVDGFVHDGCDILAWLTALHEALGIAGGDENRNQTP